MNPRKEFISAIMSVLRLEQNVYVTASIEEIIEKLDVKDYTKFISFLGSREAEYEKPIQSVAKGVNEFYELKLLPHKNKAEEMIKKIDKANKLMATDIVKSFKPTTEQEARYRADAERGYSLQGEVRVSAYYDGEVAKGGYNKVLSILKMPPTDIFIKEFLNSEGEKIYSDEILEVMIFSNSIESNKEKIYEYYLQGKIKPSIEEKIIMEESGEDFSINSAVKALLPKTTIWS